MSSLGQCLLSHSQAHTRGCVNVLKGLSAQVIIGLECASSGFSLELSEHSVHTHKQYIRLVMYVRIYVLMKCSNEHIVWKLADITLIL